MSKPPSAFDPTSVTKTYESLIEKFEALEYHAPLTFMETRGITRSDLDEVRDDAGSLLVDFGIEVVIAEFEGDFVVKYRWPGSEKVIKNRTGDDFTYPHRVDKQRLKVRLRGIHEGADIAGPCIHDGLTWFEPEEQEPGAWKPTTTPEIQGLRNETAVLKKYHGIEVHFAECPAAINDALDRNTGRTTHRWLIKWRHVVFPMTDLEFHVWMHGLSVGSFDGRRPEDLQPRSRRRKILDGVKMSARKAVPK
jgi:hypothetical protein